MEKSRKDIKIKMRIPRGGVTRPPSQIKNNSYSVIARKEKERGKRNKDGTKPYH